MEQAQERARTAIDVFKRTLQGRLLAAIEDGGPEGAIGVCREVAPAVASETSAEQRLDIGRTALRLRNPDNAPDVWEREVMLRFQARMAEGEEPGNLSAKKVVRRESGQVLRYMAPIPTGGLCLSCHGTDIDPAVREQLALYYPDDQATGFQAGDLRGAFTVRVPLEP